jgi:hypothetical protein
MNNNTRLRVRVPKALYESIQAELLKKKIKEEKTPPAQAGDASSKIDDKLMASLTAATKLINSKITTPQEFATFLSGFADKILSGESFADSLNKNSSYKQSKVALGRLSGNSETPEAAKK